MQDDLLGKIVLSKRGRDADRLFVIMKIFNDDYVYIADGDLRKIEKPKKKKLKHLKEITLTKNNLRDYNLSVHEINNSKLKSHLQSIDTNREV